MILYNKTGHFTSRQFLTLRSDTSSKSFYIQNKMIETPGAKIRIFFFIAKISKNSWFYKPKQAILHQDSF